jgi:hypothetical protein
MWKLFPRRGKILPCRWAKLRRTCRVLVLRGAAAVDPGHLSPSLRCHGRMNEWLFLLFYWPGVGGAACQLAGSLP